jgi:integrase
MVFYSYTVAKLPRKVAWKSLIEEHPDFKRWYDNLARGSTNTANENARVLFRFMKKQEITLGDILTRSEQDRRGLENMLFDFVTEQEQQGYAPTYIANYLKVVNSWLTFNNQQPIKKIKIGNRNRRTTIEDERIPNKDELKQILNYADERGRTSISLIASQNKDAHGVPCPVALWAPSVPRSFGAGPPATRLLGLGSVRFCLFSSDVCLSWRGF